MSDLAIRVDDLGKQYRIGRTERYRRFSELLSGLATAPLRGIRRLRQRVGGARPGRPDTFWALQDVSFEVNKGEVIGVIGRNGAGKSTLLKILARITEPTTGRAEIYGRVGSLLEVGTGFHPELTGRENIYLNGAILGMTRFEINRRFDEIVAFAEVDQFLDTPVKRYSSGMRMRLAFAVAAHLEPEILLVDEVLAVGDVAFQQKCLGKMDEIASGGRTVLFVSHNLNAVEQLCQRVLLLEHGRLVRFGSDTRAVLSEYMSPPDSTTPATEWINAENQFPNDWFTPLRFFLCDGEGTPLHMPVRNDSPIYLRLTGRVTCPTREFTAGYAIYTRSGQCLYWSCITDTSEQQWPRLSAGYCSIETQIPSRLLNEGVYRIELVVKLPGRQWLCSPGHNAPTIFLSVKGGLSESPRWTAKREGLLAPVLRWNIVDGEAYHRESATTRDHLTLCADRMAGNHWPAV